MTVTKSGAGSNAGDTSHCAVEFHYINRVADALGIDPEPEVQQAYEKWQAGS
jgi:uncharacterized tellurite resistance protein B-like protein